MKIKTAITVYIDLTIFTPFLFAFFRNKCIFAIYFLAFLPQFLKFSQKITKNRLKIAFFAQKTGFFVKFLPYFSLK
jgi:hypothetical protein